MDCGQYAGDTQIRVAAVPQYWRRPPSRRNPTGMRRRQSVQCRPAIMIAKTTR